ncbi:MAG: hypothetical protein F6K31_12230 [Symploca sp. SIO2G7]|nr:hypothetical protein [Symploca sp. SIO2G7]
MEHYTHLTIDDTDSIFFSRITIINSLTVLTTHRKSDRYVLSDPSVPNSNSQHTIWLVDYRSVGFSWGLPLPTPPCIWIPNSIYFCIKNQLLALALSFSHIFLGLW